MSRDREDFTNAAVLGVTTEGGAIGAHVIKTRVDGQPAIAVRITFATEAEREAYIATNFNGDYQDTFADVPEEA